MAKLVQLSDDNGIIWNTLPGGSGAFTMDGAEIDDTVFGQTYQSQQTGLIGWSIEANALYKGFAGYVATVKKQGTTTAMTTEAMTLESGKIYRIDDRTKDVWDRAATFTVFDNAIDHNADVEWIDFLFGRVKFLDAYTVIAPVTVTGSFFPTVALGKANSFDLTQTADAVDNSDFATVQANTGHRTFTPGLRTVSLDLSGFYDVANAFRADLIARNEFIVELNPDGNVLSVARGFFNASDTGQSGDVGALEEETISFVLKVPLQQVDGVTNVFRPFGWIHDATTTLATAIQIALTAFLDETEIDARYLYDGINGVSGNCIVTDVSLSGGLEVMNEFTATVQGTGVTTDVGTG